MIEAMTPVARWGAIRTVDSTEARQNFRRMIEEASRYGRRLIIARNGRPEAALVSLRDLDLIKKWEAELDRLSADALAGREPTPSADSLPIAELIQRRTRRVDIVASEPDILSDRNTGAGLGNLFGSIGRFFLRPAPSPPGVDIEKIARQTSALVINQIKGHIETDLDAKEEREIKATVRETVLSAVESG